MRTPADQTGGAYDTSLTGHEYGNRCPSVTADGDGLASKCAPRDDEPGGEGEGCSEGAGSAEDGLRVGGVVAAREVSGRDRNHAGDEECEGGRE